MKDLMLIFVVVGTALVSFWLGIIYGKISAINSAMLRGLRLVKSGDI